jgi:hypothetical protein
MRLKGRFDAEEKADEVVRKESTHDVKKGFFSIKVKGTEPGKYAYESDAEPFEYKETDSLVNALRLEGANLTDDAISFINEALAGEETGKAVKEVITIYNDRMKADAKSSAYAAIANEHKPVTAESIENSKARMVRDFMRQTNCDAEVAINKLREFVPNFKDYTLAEFQANKGRV